MKYSKRSLNQTDIQIATFSTEKGVTEYQILIIPADPCVSFTKQLSQIAEACHTIMADTCPEATPVFRRYFMSDAANQHEAISNIDKQLSPCPTSFIQQPPLNGTKIAVWIYAQTDMSVKQYSNRLLEASHNGYKHLWSGGLHNR